MIIYKELCLACLFFLMANKAFSQDMALSGTVRDLNNKNLQEAVVSLEPDRHSVRTNHEGQYHFSQLYPGKYYVLVTHPDYVDFLDSIVIVEGKSLIKDMVLQSKPLAIHEVLITEQVSSQTYSDNLLKMNRAAMPIQVISRQTIEMMGSRRLDEVLKEQTGVAMVNNISGGGRSVGVQLQGFGSEYVMVLIDGQPMVGRNNGNFDLSRISVSNIERIEIIKGASSCLFGSDALGGAINIITRYGAVQPQARIALNYGTLNMVDATVDAEAPFKHQRGSIQLSSNYYRTDGFNTNPHLQSGQTSPPYRNFDVQAKARYQLLTNTYLGSSLRYGSRESDMSKKWDNNWISKDKQGEQDINYSLTLDHTFRSGWRSMSRYYLSYYHVDQFNKWNDQANNSELTFVQLLNRFEQQFAKSYRSGYHITGGFGGSLEKMDDRSIGKVPLLSTGFGYIQGDKNFFEKLDVRAGLRFDKTNTYGGKINPSLGFQYYLNEKISFKTGVGTGFKAPDYRMRYLVFFNPAANYMVIGNDLLSQTFQQMQQDGEISEVLNGTDRLNKNLQSEKSTSFNLGTQWNPFSKFTAEAGLFYHNIRNQIDAVPVATGTQISQIFSYRNLPRAVNKGFEANVKWDVINDLSIQVGYQYLIAKDLSVTDSIRAGHWPYNQNLHDPSTGISRAPQVSDYWGIVNRSRHMLNIQAFYHFKPWDSRISVRANYRGKYPFADYNNNGYIDRFDIFVPGHFLLNASIEKRLFQDRMGLRLTIDNMLNFKNQLMPGQPGRLLIGGVSYRIN